MKTAIFLFVLALSFLECEQSRSCIGCTSSDKDAYENLFKSKKVTVALQPDCSDRMVEVITQLERNTRRFSPRSPCNTGIPDRKPGYKDQIVVYVDPPSTETLITPRPGPSGKAFYLRQDDNKNTYMILDSAQAHWFFTAALGGCDMFVATNAAHPQKPLLIHANRNEDCNHATNFNLKQISTDAIIANHPGYVLRARLHPYRPGLTDYWKTYKRAHPSISRKFYNKEGRVSCFSCLQRTFQPHTFFGFYDPNTDSWTFKYKGDLDGKVESLPLTP